MNILLIGIEDIETLKKFLEEVFTSKLEYFCVNDIQRSMEMIEKSYIDFFVIDTKYGYYEIKNLIDKLETLETADVKGAYVCDRVNDALNILAINSGRIDGILFKPYNMEDFLYMRGRIEKKLNG